MTAAEAYVLARQQMGALDSRWLQASNKEGYKLCLDTMPHWENN